QPRALADQRQSLRRGTTLRGDPRRRPGLPLRPARARFTLHRQHLRSEFQAFRDGQGLHDRLLPLEGIPVGLGRREAAALGSEERGARLKTALVQCPSWWTVDPPLGLAQIAGCLTHAGHEVGVFDLNAELAKRKPVGYENLWNWEQFQFWNRPELVERFFR